MAAPSAAPRRLTSRSGGLPDRLFRSASGLAAIGVTFLIIAIGVMLALNSTEAFGRFGLSFITNTVWDPVAEVFGALPYIVGTLLSSAIALTIAAPIGILTAIFLAELAPRRLSIPLTFLIELLAAIPSVVFGLWGVFVLSPFLGS